MKTYIITYDLIQNKNYNLLYSAIKTYNKWAKVTESTWAVVTEKSAKEIRDHLGSVTDTDDRLFVIKSGVEAAWRNTICKNEWLKDNL